MPTKLSSLRESPELAIFCGKVAALKSQFLKDPVGQKPVILRLAQQIATDYQEAMLAVLQPAIQSEAWTAFLQREGKGEHLRSAGALLVCTPCKLSGSPWTTDELKRGEHIQLLMVDKVDHQFIYNEPIFECIPAHIKKAGYIEVPSAAKERAKELPKLLEEARERVKQVIGNSVCL